jgi:hypothetical protein
MNVYTAHTRVRSRPLLIREGFSWGAFIFGPFWLLAHRAWIAAVVVICAFVLIRVLPLDGFRPVFGFALAWLLGIFGQDIRRWSLERGGYLLAHVVAARDEDSALARLLDRRPDLIAEAVR